MAKCTNKTFLMYKATDSATGYTKLVDITEYPSLFGTPDKLDATTLSDDRKKEIDGIMNTESMEFKAWYESEDFDKLLALKDKLTSFKLYFGKDGAEGIFAWEGKLSVSISSGGTNAVREMTFTITDEGETPLTKVTA